jgi:hypothetical protein
MLVGNTKTVRPGNVGVERPTISAALIKKRYKIYYRSANQF